jgi:hypothetical protein
MENRPGGRMGGFAAEMQRRLDRAREAVRVARESGDEYGAATHLAELELLVRMAREHGLEVAPSVLAAIDAAGQPRGGTGR